MPRNKRSTGKKAKKLESSSYRYCLYCKANRDGRGFDKHQAACKIRWQIQRRHKDRIVRSQSAENQESELVETVKGDSLSGSAQVSKFVW